MPAVVKLTGSEQVPPLRLQVPIDAVPFRKVMVPVGTMALAVEETVAMSVVLLLMKTGLTELVRAVCEVY